MADLRSALMNSGLLPERMVREQEAVDQLDQEERDKKLRKDHGEEARRMDILRDGGTSPETFRREAWLLLKEKPNLIYNILNIGHGRDMDKRKNQGGGRLMVNLRQLRNLLNEAKHLPLEEQRKIVTKNFFKK